MGSARLRLMSLNNLYDIDFWLLVFSISNFSLFSIHRVRQVFLEVAINFDAFKIVDIVHEDIPKVRIVNVTTDGDGIQ